MTTATKERPILASDLMVRLMIAGLKLQTRRVMLPQPAQQPDGGWNWHDGKRGMIGSDKGFRILASGYCPYGQPGDRLWVRERFTPLTTEPKKGETPGVMFTDGAQKWANGRYYQKANPVALEDWPSSVKWKPSIHMPRWASRMTLTVENVRLQRVQETSDRDQLLEGLRSYRVAVGRKVPTLQANGWDWPTWWDRINLERGYGYASNPWVWAITFSVGISYGSA